MEGYKYTIQTSYTEKEVGLMQFVFNLDQAISYNNQPVSMNLQYMFDFLKDHGHQLIFTSTEAVRNMLPKLDRRFHNEAMIGLDGAVICKNGELSQLSTFQQSDMQSLHELIERYDATYVMEGDWDYSYTGGQFHNIAQKLDMSELAQNVKPSQLAVSRMTILSADGMEDMQREVETLGFYTKIVGSHEPTLMITPHTINKWHALQQIGVVENDYVAIGSDLTDLAVLEHAEYASMIGYIIELADYAVSRLPDDDKVEKRIIDKCYELSKKYTV